MNTADTSSAEPLKRRSNGRLFKLDANEIQSPWIAWPTVVMGILSAMLWVWSLLQIVELDSFQISLRLCLYSALSFVACFATFTPAHDAAHKAIGRTTPLARAVNEVIGRLSTVTLLVPFAAFRHVHLLHHKYTNHPEKDPDFFSQGGISACVFQEFYYYYFLFSNWTEVPGHVWAESILTIVLTVLGVSVGVDRLGWEPVFWGILLPQRLAVVYLAYCFDYVPHHEAQGQPHTDPYLVTKKISGFFSNGSCRSNWLLRAVVANQDAHVVHHLYPTVPFYLYHDIWASHEKEFYQAGVLNTSLFG